MMTDQLALISSEQPATRHAELAIQAAMEVPESLSHDSHRIQLKVIRADGLPSMAFFDKVKRAGRSEHFYVTANDGATSKATKVFKRKKQSVEWDVMLDGLAAGPSSRLTLRLLAKRENRVDVVLGALDLSYPDLLQTSDPRDFNLVSTDRSPGHSERITLRLQVITIEHTARLAEPSDAFSSSHQAPISAEMVDVPAGTAPSTPSPADAAPGTPSLAELLHRVDLTILDDSVGRLSSPPPVVVGTADDVEQVPTALGQMRDIYETWREVLARIKWVVDCTEKIAEIHPYAKMAWSVLSFIPKTLLAQVERDENVKALLAAMHDAFDLAHDANAFESHIRQSTQREILMAMLKHVCACGEFVQTYANDIQFWRRLWKNAGHGVDSRIQDYCVKLMALRDGFLRHAAVTVERTTFQILDSVGGVSVQVDRVAGRLDGISDQLMGVLDEVTDASMSVKIDQIPYPTGASFNSDRGCLTGTRTAFLDHVTSWVSNPDSTRGLVLFGRAGTGKSSIAHEVARRFRKMDRLASSFIFLRGQRSSREPHLFFTGLARDLSDRYPAFRASLGKCIQHDTYARIGAVNFGALFENMLLQPLANTTLAGPVFVVVDALDE
ncbi:hypothetical protein BC834DRAFT_962373, partial [Gloeopeniophorella convolvens]